jgi:hypothetical protein
MDKQLSAVVQEYVRAVQAQADAEQAVAVAKEILTSVFATEGISVAEHDGKRVSLIEAVRRNFDVETLRGLVSAKVFEAVTKTAVEPKAFDKARKAGDITNEAETACVRPTPYVRIVVADVAEASQAVAV